MNVSIKKKSIDTATIQQTEKGGEIRGLPAGTYLCMVMLPIAVGGGWFALSVDVTGDAVIDGNGTADILVSGNGYARINTTCIVRIGGTSDGVCVRVDSNAPATMRSRGSIYIMRI